MIEEETRNLIDAPTIEKNPLARIARGVKNWSSKFP